MGQLAGGQSQMAWGWTPGKLGILCWGSISIVKLWEMRPVVVRSVCKCGVDSVANVIVASTPTGT